MIPIDCKINYLWSVNCFTPLKGLKTIYNLQFTIDPHLTCHCEPTDPLAIATLFISLAFDGQPIDPPIPFSDHPIDPTTHKSMT